MGDVREWAAQHGEDWRATLNKIQEHYGYDKFGGVCHMVPNHAIVLLALLHGNDNFQRSLMIATTSGWDTDCNAGNVGCILGIKNGLTGVDAGPDWRGPVADCLFLPTADGGRCITDAVRETYSLVNMGRGLTGQEPTAPKDSARFHFSLPGSVQGFQPEDSAQVRGTVTVGNEDGKLALRLHHLARGRAARVATATFVPPSALGMPGYELVCSPTLYPGQTVTAQVEAAQTLTGPVSAALYVGIYGENNVLALHRGPAKPLAPGGSAALTLLVPDTQGQPVAEVGVELTSESRVSGMVLLERLTWNGKVTAVFGQAAHGDLWKRAWVNAVSQFESGGSSELPYRVIQNEGTGLVIQGEQEWTNYTVSVRLLPHLAKRLGLAGAVRGLRRYVALLLDEDGKARLIEQRDGQRRVLAESEAMWQREEAQTLSMTVTPTGITARCGEASLTAAGADLPTRGAIGLLADTGYGEFGPVTVRPA